jgi:hypothetical protein
LVEERGEDVRVIELLISGDGVNRLNGSWVSYTSTLTKRMSPTWLTTEVAFSSS